MGYQCSVGGRGRIMKAPSQGSECVRVRGEGWRCLHTLDSHLPLQPRTVPAPSSEGETGTLAGGGFLPLPSLSSVLVRLSGLTGLIPPTLSGNFSFPPAPPSPAPLSTLPASGRPQREARRNLTGCPPTLWLTDIGTDGDLMRRRFCLPKSLRELD